MEDKQNMLGIAMEKINEGDIVKVIIDYTTGSIRIYKAKAENG